MNVACTHCETIFRVDPKKVPHGGVQARCSVCSGVFFVPQAEQPQPQPQPQPHSPAPARSGMGPPSPLPPVRARPVAAPAPPSVGTPPSASASGVGVTPPTSAPPPPQRSGLGTALPPAVARPINPFLAQDPSTKARRLARALISDLVVYHPAKRADGLRDGSLKILFEEEIQKCWEEYTEQVGNEMANSTGYFNEALNEILADGRPVFP